MFNQEHNEDNEQAWSVEFFRNNSQEVTGEGDAQRVFATVLGAIQTFIKKYKPNRVIFSASKEVEPGQNAQSRANLYDRLVQRYAKSWGFKAFRADTGNKVHYELSRINKGVSEGSEQISIQVRKGRSKFATELSVDGKPAGAYQYDADSGRSIAEVYPEYKGKGFGKILVLHAIYTAAKLGMDFVEDESRTAEYDNVLDSLDSNGLAVNDDGYWYVTGEGEHFLKQRLKQGVAENFAEQQTLDDLFADIKNRGGKILGRGNNSIVFTNPDDANTVIKVMHRPDPASLAYLRHSRKHSNNPWMPQVLSVNSVAVSTPDHRSTTTVWLIVFENLERASSADVTDAVHRVLDTVDSKHLGTKPVNTYRTFDEIKKLWPVIARYSSDKDIQVVAEFLSQFRPQDIDLSPANVMMRGSQLVFVDPVLS